MSRPARGLTAKGAATRARIVDAAASLMFERGVAGTSLDEVLAASGTGRSQLYHYFADKDQLVMAVIRRQTERVLSAQDPYLHQADSMEGLRRWCDAIIDLQKQHDGFGGCPLGSLASELADSDDETRLLLQHSFQTWQDHLSDGLRTMQTRGELRPDADPDDLAAALLAAVQGGLLLAQTTHSTHHLELSLAMALAHVTSYQHASGDNLNR